MSSALGEWLSTTKGVSAGTSGLGEQFCIEVAKAEVFCGYRSMVCSISEE